mgnify:CR=1 FL=1
MLWTFKPLTKYLLVFSIIEFKIEGTPGSENTFLVKRNLIDENQMYVIVGNKLVSKKIEIVQVSEENAIIRGLKNNDLILNESIKDAYDGMEIRYKN